MILASAMTRFDRSRAERGAICSIMLNSRKPHPNLMKWSPWRSNEYASPRPTQPYPTQNSMIQSVLTMKRSRLGLHDEVEVGPHVNEAGLVDKSVSTICETVLNQETVKPMSKM